MQEAQRTQPLRFAQRTGARDLSAVDRLNAPPEARQWLDQRAVQLMEEALRWRSPSDLLATYTRPAVAAHEAGHAIVMAAEGVPVKSVRVWRKAGLWTGLTTECEPWRLSPDMGPEPYLKRARIQMGGWCGELLAGCDVIGSSVDEIATSQGITGQAALLLGANHVELWLNRVLAPTFAWLDRYRVSHQRLVALLQREKRVSGSRLAALLPDPDLEGCAMANRHRAAEDKDREQP